MKKLNHSLLTHLLPALLLACLCAGTAAAQAQAHQVDLSALIDETQKSLPDADRMSIVWWIPEEFWQVNFAQDASIPKAQAEEFLRTVRPYVIIAVVDGKIGTFGGVTYKSEEAIRGMVQLVDTHGGIHRPLPGEKVDPDTKNLLAMMKPVFSNMIGKMGENVQFLVFPSKDSRGRKLADAVQEGSLTVKLGADVLKWRLPLGALLPAKSCPVDGERLNGAWKFCPWHGDKLVVKQND